MVLTSEDLLRRRLYFIKEKDQDMCMFCAAIPATLAVGVKMNADQNRPERKPGAGGRPVKTVTLVMIAALAAASIVYHSQQGG